MKRLSSAVVLLLAMALNLVVAAPARRQPFTHTQPDGTTITVKLQGDEFHHYYTTTDGDYVTLCDDGYFRYTVIDADNNLVAGNVVVGSSSPASIKSMRNSIATRHSELQSAHRQLRAIKDDRSGMMRRAAQKAASSNNEVRGLIILVNFSDKSFVTDAEVYQKMMNNEGYTDSYGSIGSARDYFIDQSYGAFNPSFDIVGPITLSRTMSYYGGNDRYGQDQYPDVMISEACEIASQQGLVDMSDYDLDNDGWVDLVYVIYAGYGENVGGVSTSAVWPHAWYIYQGAGRTVQIDNVYLDAYACSSELAGGSGSQPDGIGTFCHEYSHTLGLPDLYDIDYSGGVGMNNWSVMDQGCYAMNGYVPISYTAFERYTCGWIELNELTEACTINMPDINNDKYAAYKISSSDNNQFITLETRTRKGWDIGLPAEGMMITAIDYSASVWNDNAPNDNPSRQRVQLIPADNRWNESSMAGDLYPYNGNNSLTSSSSPAMQVYTTTIYDKPITDITYSDGVSTFNFMGGGNAYINAPVATSAGNISPDNFTAYWSPVENASSYTLYVERIDNSEAPEFALEETFEKFTDNVSVDISSSLDDYTTLPGWSGLKVFCNSGEAKLGSNSSPGRLTTPVCEVETDNVISFQARCVAEKDATGTLTITITNCNGSATCDIAMSELPYDTRTTINIPNAYGGPDTQVEFYCTKRIYIDDIKIKNGTAESNAQERNNISITFDEADYTRSEAPMMKAEYVSESATFEHITSTSYKVTEVVEAVHPGTYRYKVKAVSEQGSSQWSNTIKVIVTDINNAVVTPDYESQNIYAYNGNIYIDTSTTQDVTIYNMQGCVIATLKAYEGTTVYTPTTAGIYLVRCGNRVDKVSIR